MHSSTIQGTAIASGQSALAHHPHRPSRYSYAAPPRASVWPALVATICAGALLWTFHQVVQTSVQQAEVRTQAAADHAHAALRCHPTLGSVQRGHCLDQLNPSRRYVAALSSTNGAVLGAAIPVHR
jgi:hypothetical protein